MPGKFEEGDIVRCIEEGFVGAFTIGNEYEIGGNFYEEGSAGGVVANDSGRPDAWHENFFELVRKSRGPW